MTPYEVDPQRVLAQVAELARRIAQGIYPRVRFDVVTPDVITGRVIDGGTATPHAVGSESGGNGWTRRADDRCVRDT